MIALDLYCLAVMEKHNLNENSLDLIRKHVNLEFALDATLEEIRDAVIMLRTETHEIPEDFELRVVSDSINSSDVYRPKTIRTNSDQT